ncbi:MAG: serine/threonine protein kinase [Burkholderiales bacterium]|nr:serine/threonine protein kinase [Burkholderiales bacterium]
MSSELAAPVNADGPRERPPRTLHPEDLAEREAQARRARLRLRFALALLASVSVLGAIGLWTDGAVERSLRALRTVTLGTLLEAQTKTLQVWIEDQTLAVQRLARDPKVRDSVAALAAIAARPGTAPEQYCAAPARRPLVAQLDDALAGSGTIGFNVIDRGGRIIASTYPAYCGLEIRRAAFSERLAPVFRGETLFFHPSADADRLVRPPADAPLAQPVVWIKTPVRDEHRLIIAALGVGQYASGQFAAILAAARGGETAEVYAFDRTGLMLSESRYTEALRASGRLGQRPGTTLSFVLRPPHAPAGTLTRLAEAARDGTAAGEREGMLLEPYAGYRGEPVIGAWRWIEAYDIGIAVEMGADEAYAPLVLLRAVFGAVFAALILAVLSALAAWFVAAKLRGEAGARHIGPYRLGARIGEGGVGNVYAARHDLLKRPTALKLLKPARATDELVARFEREAQLASQLSHPHMVEIFDYGRAADGSLYYAMEYLDGETVGAIVLREGAMPVARAVHLLRQVCAGLAEAHGKGMVHRDVSATNIMVCRYGGEYDFVKILDFGLVKMVDQPAGETITRSLRILGTPLYMAPERLRDPADVDARADIYAIGALAFFMLSGRRLFDSDDTLALTSRVLNEVPPKLSAVAPQPIPDALEGLVAACLEKRREDRPPDIGALSAVLERLEQAQPWTQRDAEAAWARRAAAQAG